MDREMVEVTRSLSTFLFSPLVAGPGEGGTNDLTHRPSPSPAVATSLNCRRRRRCRRHLVIVVVAFRHRLNPVVVNVAARSFLGLVPAGR